MAGDRKGSATFYLRPLPFSKDKKWPETESGQRRGVARERNALKKEIRWKKK